MSKRSRFASRKQHGTVYRLVVPAIESAIRMALNSLVFDIAVRRLGGKRPPEWGGA